MVSIFFPPFYLMLPALISHILNMLEQAKRMKDKPKYTSMGQYIHPPDSTPDSHLQIGPKNFPFEDRTEPPLHKNTKLGKPTIQALHSIR